MNRIIYLQDNGVLAVIIPNEELISLYGIDAIAKKDVPEGKPYKVVRDSDIPSDRSMRAAWTIDEFELTDGFGSAFSTFEEISND